jgi:hypothetical protein
LLREDIPRLEAKFGADNLFVEVLKAQLAALQNPAVQKRQRKRLHFGVLSFAKSLMPKKHKASGQA